MNPPVQNFQGPALNRSDAVGQGVLNVPSLKRHAYKRPSFMDIMRSPGEAPGGQQAMLGLASGLLSGGTFTEALGRGLQGYGQGVDQGRTEALQNQSIDNEIISQDFQNQLSVNAEGRAGTQEAREAALSPHQLKAAELANIRAAYEPIEGLPGWYRDVATGKTTSDPKITAAFSELKRQDAAIDLSTYGQKARLQAEASAAYDTVNYQSTNVETPEGAIIGGRFNPRAGQFEVQGENGWTAAPAGSRAVTDGAGGSVTPLQFNKLESEISSDEVALNKMVDYANTAGSLPAGIDRMVNDISAKWKTAFGDPLAVDEFKQQYASGQVQSLVGALRLDVLGPGVLTEQDAMRLMNYLGGDPSSIFQNPELLNAAMTTIVQDRMSGYQTRIKQYNRSAPAHGAGMKNPTDYMSRMNEKKTVPGLSPAVTEALEIIGAPTGN